MDNIGVKGKVVYAGTSNGIAGLEVFAVDFDPINEEQILNPKSKPELTKPDGSFEIRYSPDAYNNWYEGREPDIVVRVYGPCLRLVFESPEFTDVKDSILDIGDCEIHKDNIEGWLVTYATLNPKNGDPVWLTEGNKIEPLIDGAKVFPELTDLVTDAKKSINLMNFRFEATGDLISKPPDPFEQPMSGMALSGKRVQEILFDQGSRIPTRVLVWDFNAEAILAFVLGLIASGVSLVVGGPILELLIRVLFVGGAGFIHGSFIGGIFGDSGMGYFHGSNVETRAFRSLWSIMHARVVVVDEVTALVMGSSISRGYFSNANHCLHDARHGGSLLHDVSVKITGPAVEHLDRTFTTVWNQSGPSGSDPLKPATNQKMVSEANVAGVQVLRTLPGDTFSAAHTNVQWQRPQASSGKRRDTLR